MDIRKFKASSSGRVDVILTELLGESRSQVSKKIKNGAVTVNGNKVTSASFKVCEGDDIEFTVIEEVKKEIEKPVEEVHLDYVYKDSDIAVINKPRGMVVHPAPGHNDDTLVNYLFDDEDFEFDRTDTENVRPGIVHRIDKDTSGLLAIALNEDSESALQMEIREKDFHRCYLALVYGDVKDKKFRIEAPLTRPNHTERKALVDIYKGRDAITHCTLLANNGKVSLLKCTLETGRTHQIRAHLAYIGFPIVGDTLYGRKGQDVAIADQGQALHAYSLSLIHPRTLERMTFRAPLDDYFKSLIRYFYK